MDRSFRSLSLAAVLVAQAYTVVDLGNVDARALRDGVVVGASSTDGGALNGSNEQAFAYSIDGGWTYFGQLFQDRFTIAVGVDPPFIAGQAQNASGSDVGWIGSLDDGGVEPIGVVPAGVSGLHLTGTANFGGHNHAFDYFIMPNSTPGDLGVIGTGSFSSGRGIEGPWIYGNGPAAGSSGTHCFLYSILDELKTDVGTLGGDRCSPYAVSADGILVGESEVASLDTHAFYGNFLGLTDMGTLGGVASRAVAVKGDNAVGWSLKSDNGYSHAFVYDLPTELMLELPRLPGDVYADVYALNGEYAVGDSYDGGHRRAVRWKLSDLSVEMIEPPGWSNTQATMIDDEGNILANGKAPDGGFRTFLLVPESQSPEAVADSYPVHTGKTLSEDAPGVLDNDVDPQNKPLHAILFEAPKHASSFTLGEDGSFTYTSDPAFTGDDDFAYEASNGAASSAPVFVTIHVQDQAPAAGAYSYGVHAGKTLHVDPPGLLLGAGDPDTGDSVHVAGVGGFNHGSVTAFTAEGAFTYVPETGFAGSDTFTVQLSDGALVTSATVDIEVVDQGPVANDDTFTVHAGTRLTLAAPGLLVNDTDGDGDHLTVAAHSAQPEHAKLFAVGADGSLVYEPDDGFFGTDTLTYTVNDGVETSTIAATVTINVQDEAPTAVLDWFGGVHDAPIQGNVLTNDFDPENDPLAVFDSGKPEHGSLTMHADGSFEYVPAAGFTGLDQFVYSVTDHVRVSLNTIVIVDVHQPTQSAGQIDAAGGSIVNDATLSTLTVPPGAVANAVTFLVGPASQPVTAPSGYSAVGAPVAVEPSGTTFSTPATLSLPVPAGADRSSLFVVQQESNGSQTLLTPVIGASGMTVKISGLSVFQPVSKAKMASSGCASSKANPGLALTLLIMISMTWHIRRKSTDRRRPA